MELAEDLAAKGHKVTVITPIPRYNVAQIDPRYHRKLFVIENTNNIRVIRVRSFWIHMVGPVKRGLGQLGLAALFAVSGFKAGKQDLVFAYSPPLTLGLSCYLLSRAYRIPYVFNVQDLFPQNAIDLGILRNHYLIRFFRALENNLARSDEVHIEFAFAGSESSQWTSLYGWAYTLEKEFPTPPQERKSPFFHFSPATLTLTWAGWPDAGLPNLQLASPRDSYRYTARRDRHGPP